ncbi:hypothetical protein [Litoreibacter albidus]|uniref:Transferrin-binding protein B C-lobe/N-lobe beta barrel domain-containing protein n=1 Tax=Litoreibacter albidus TaxID=670155 RepID=A0A1H2S6T9_9RHOB|nr:hypothetical protein [Litoreibacter albidus]SDW26679.1 hypothetical protein SAMN04488001_0697 [Litoreibacter albidus]
MSINTAVKAFGILSITAMVACGGSGSNPVTGGDSDDDVVTDPGTDPNASLTNAAFLFDPSKNLVANRFDFTPGATPGTGTITINNLPFDGVSSEGGAYTPRPGVVLPNGEVYQNTPNSSAEDQYYAVVLTSPTTGTGALVGAVATNAYRGSGYGGAYASRPEGAKLPPTQAATYQYTGTYNGIRVLRQQEDIGATNAIQLTTGKAEINIDLQDFDLTGAIRGQIIDRRLFDLDGNEISVAGRGLGRIGLVITNLNPDTLMTESDSTNPGTTNTRNLDNSFAQTGTWNGMVSGPNGEEVAGFLVVEGQLSDFDPNYDSDTTRDPVTGRETGGFITSRP